MDLKELEHQSTFVIREAFNKFKNPVVLWSIGKDSTTLLWLIKKAFPFGKIPFKVLHIDTGYKFQEIYEFRDRIAKEWGFELLVAKNENTLATPEQNCFDCCNERKTAALKQAVKKYKIDALLLGIRRDEHGIRNIEHYFSPRDKQFKWNVVREKEQTEEGDSPFESMQDAEFAGWNIFATEFHDADHVRVHPILHWSELEIWEYVMKENIPLVDLYLAKNGKRFRSIGCETCCLPVKSEADTVQKIVDELKVTKVKERSGRVQDKEEAHIMQKLRHLGYM